MCHAIEARGWHGDKQILLFFTSERIIVMHKGWLADITGSGIGAGIGGLLLQIPLIVADHSSQKKKLEEVKQVEFDRIIEKNKGSYGITYDNIKSVEMKKTFGGNWLEIMTTSGEHRFNSIRSEKNKDGFIDYNGVVSLLGNLMPNKFTQITRGKK